METPPDSVGPADWSRVRAAAARAAGVVFDFGGVISVSPMAGWDKTLYPYVRTLGLRPEHVRDGFRRYRRLWDGDEISFADMYRRIFADAALPPPTDAALAEIRRLDAASWAETLRPDTLAFMRELKAAGKKLGILSNMSSDFFTDYYAPKCADYRALADVEVISGHERLCKPAPELYDRAAERMGLAPADLVFFDDFPENVAGARARGWAGELYPLS